MILVDCVIVLGIEEKKCKKGKWLPKEALQIVEERKEAKGKGKKGKIHPTKGFPGGASGKDPTCQCRRLKRCRFDPWVKKIPWRKAWQSISVFLPGESYGQRSLSGYSP